MKDLNNINIQDIQHGDSEDFYTNFREKLLSVEQFPSLYTFKFIIPTNEETKEQIRGIFQHASTKISVKESKTGKYNSLSVETFVNNVDEVIDYYKKVSTIDKVMML